MLESSSPSEEEPPNAGVAKWLLTAIAPATPRVSGSGDAGDLFIYIKALQQILKA